MLGLAIIPYKGYLDAMKAWKKNVYVVRLLNKWQEDWAPCAFSCAFSCTSFTCWRIEKKVLFVCLFVYLSPFGARMNPYP